jgi:hypothetical protein
VSPGLWVVGKEKGVGMIQEREGAQDFSGQRFLEKVHP